MLTKVCCKCKGVKSLDAYGKRLASKDGLKSRCRACAADDAQSWHKRNPESNVESVRKWRARNPEKVKLHTKRRSKTALAAAQRKHKYGLTNSAYLEMLSAQNGKCAICRSVLLLDGPKREKPQVDHCHKSGKVRGLLCSECNHGLGRFRDNIGCMTAAIEYLRRIL